MMRKWKVRPLLAALLCMALLACGSEPQRPAGPVGVGVPPDFRGAWEVDFSQSENIRDRYEMIVRELQRDAQRRSRGGMNQSKGSAVSIGGSGGGESLYALARMAELITDVQLLDIEQEDGEISIKREGSFALQCEFHGTELHTVETPLGSELCGWDGHQLVFQVYLPEGLRIIHRFTLGPEGQRLNMATTLQSTQLGYPFSLNRVYNRYDPSRSGISCKQTLTRGRVCTTEKQAR